jgi:hypothetical protein
VDVAKGPHEGQLDGDDASGEESWCVEYPPLESWMASVLCRSVLLASEDEIGRGLTGRIAYYIAFGPHGPRALDPPGEGWRVAGYTFLGLAISLAVFIGIRSFAGEAPHTMNREWEEATNEYLKVRLLSLSPNHSFLEDCRTLGV